MSQTVLGRCASSTRRNSAELGGAFVVAVDQLRDPAPHTAEPVLVRRADFHLVLERDQVQGLAAVRQRVGRPGQFQGYVEGVPMFFVKHWDGFSFEMVADRFWAGPNGQRGLPRRLMALAFQAVMGLGAS